jgi:hypothetical protein
MLEILQFRPVTAFLVVTANTVSGFWFLLFGSDHPTRATG